MTLTAAEVQATRDLIGFALSRPMLSEQEAEAKQKAHFAGNAEAWAVGRRWGEVTNWRGTPMMLFESVASDPKPQLRAVQNDASLLVKAMRDGLDYYYETGNAFAPWTLWRLAILLRKQKHFELEVDMLRAFRAFYSTPDGRLGQLAARLAKLEAGAVR